MPGVAVLVAFADDAGVAAERGRGAFRRGSLRGTGVAAEAPAGR